MFPLVSYIYLVCVYFSFKIYGRVEGKTRVAGHPGEFFFSLQNESFFAFASVQTVLYSDFSTITGFDGNLRYELMPGSGVYKSSVLVCKYRGQYRVGVKEVIIEDFFGFFKLRYENKEQTEVTVMPNIVYLDGLRSSDVTSVTARDSKINRTERDVLLREYVQGDPVKDINWKTYAKTGDLMVRNRIGEEKQGVCIIMDTKRYSSDINDYLPLENKTIEATLALAMFFLKKNIPVNVVFYAAKLINIPVSSMHDFGKLYKSFSEILFKREYVFAYTYEALQADNFLFDAKMCFFVLHEKGKESEILCGELRENNVLYLNYLVTDELIKENKNDFRVATEADLKEVL
jgi:uncharacterized protein (DUF58 family)